MSVEKYLKIVEDEVSLKILDLCKIPRTTQELIEKVYEFLASKYPNLYDRTKVPQIVASRLGKLEDADALTYTNDEKWKTSITAANILKKYFAL
jgi:hypothetical protein